MAYIAPIHRPSSVRHALLIDLLAEGEESLVLARANRIEIWRLVDAQLSLVYSKVVHGTISMIQKLRPKDSPTSLLFVGTDRFEYFSLEWNPETNQLDTVDDIHDVAEKSMRDSQGQDKCLVDSSGRFMALMLWDGVISVLRLRSRKGMHKKLDWMEQVRLSEMFVRAGTFIHSETGHPKVAFLYQSKSDSNDAKLATYRLTGDDKDSTAGKFDPHRDREISIDMDDSTASLLIPVDKVEQEKRHNVRNVAESRAYLGGLLVVGETQITYVDTSNKNMVETRVKPPSIFVAWTKYDGTRYILADDYGKLHLLKLVTEGAAVVKNIELSRIGKASRASCLVYMAPDTLFVGSHYGDSQLYSLGPSADGKGLSSHLVQSLSSIAPILDFAVMDMGNREDDNQLGNEYSSGQARIVTGSGAHRDGSLRSVRSGVSLDDIGILADLQDTRGIFSIRSYGSDKVDTLVASFLTETRVFRFDSDGEIEEVGSFQGLSLRSQSLLLSNLPGDRMLQITADTVSLLAADNGATIATWSPLAGKTITNASANERWALLSIEGTALVSLSLEGNLAISSQKDIGGADQIACVHAAPQLLDVGVVGFWSSGTISLINLATLEPSHGESLRRKEDKTSIPRDIMLTQVLPSHIGGPSLFVAMDDGNVVSFSVSKADLSFSGRKSVILGTREARFHLLPQGDGVCNVFVTTDHPSLIYGSEGRIIYSAVTAEDATYVCPFDTEAFPEAIAIATETQLKLSQIGTERRTHVTRLEMGETIRRITYSPSEKAFGLGCIRREIDRGVEKISSYFRLVDEVVFDKVGEPFELRVFGGTEIVECVLRAELPDSYGNLAERFLIGTSMLSDDSTARADDSVQGRLVVLGVDSQRNPYSIMQRELKGACRCLAVMDDLIVCALTKTVVISQYEEQSAVEATLTRLASYRPSTYPVDLAIHGNIIAVADLMKSISLVEYVPGKGDEPAKLVEQARHYQSGWATAVCHVEEESWLEADAQGNLMVLRRNPEGVTLEDRRRLEMTSEMNLGEMVNRIREIAVETSPNAMIIPRAFLGTTEGAIYMFGTVASHAQDLLLRFQAKMESAIQGPGQIDFRTYRAFRNAEREGEGPFRFLDGELLERFLDVDEATQAEICQGLGPSVEDMRNIVEELRRLH